MLTHGMCLSLPLTPTLAGGAARAALSLSLEVPQTVRGDLPPANREASPMQGSSPHGRHQGVRLPLSLQRWVLRHCRRLVSGRVGAGFAPGCLGVLESTAAQAVGR